MIAVIASPSYHSALLEPLLASILSSFPKCTYLRIKLFAAEVELAFLASHAIEGLQKSRCVESYSWFLFYDRAVSGARECHELRSYDT